MTQTNEEKKRILAEKAASENAKVKVAIRAIFADKDFEHGQVLIKYLMKRCRVITPVLAATERDTLTNASLQALFLDILRTAELTDSQISEILTQYNHEYFSGNTRSFI
jgi:F0F1-type ATP synthase delta subunit